MATTPYREPISPATPYKPTKDPFVIGGASVASDGGLIRNPKPSPDKGGI